MPVISVIPDRFKTQESSLLGSGPNGKTTGQNHIRRPVRGTELKEDSFATLRVVAGSGQVVPIIDAGSRRIDPTTNKIFEIDGKRATDIYSNFFIQQVTEERAEKQQILETFGEPFIFLFGERARLISFQGVLLNTFDFNWEAEWWYNYDQFIRGTKCVENDARVFLSYDETLVTGYITAASASKNANDKNFINFQFQMFLTSYTNFSKIGDPRALPGLQNGDVGQSFNVTRGDLAPFRPTLIDTRSNVFGLGPLSITEGALESVSLVDGLTASINQVAQTFNVLQNQAETAIKRLSDLANGTVVRVPVGFAGAMEFDSTVDATSLIQVSGGGIITYSTFDQNDDEYVGSSDHYGSSVRENGVVRVDENIQLRLLQNAQMVATATAIWEAHGFIVPPTDLAFVSNMMVNAGFGLAAVGSTAAWTGQLPSPTAAIGSVSAIRPSFGLGLVEE